MMRQRNVKWLLVLACGLLSSRSVFGPEIWAQEAGALVMIVNKANPVGDVSKGDAKKLLLGQTSSWAGGAKVMLALRPAGSADRTAVLQKVCGMNESEYTRYEMQVMFTGRPAAVVHEAASSAAVKNLVRSNPGAAGFIHKSEIDGDVKAVLTIE